MRPLRRPTRATIHYHGTAVDCGTHAVIFSVNGARWEYTLASSQQVEDCIHIVRTVSAAKGFAYAKKRGLARRLDGPTAAQATLLRHRGAQASRARRVKVTLPNV
jgi:hypothetical protein